jgi:putative transposase
MNASAIAPLTGMTAMAPKRPPSADRGCQNLNRKPPRNRQPSHHRGYDRIAGALTNLGYNVGDQTIGNVLQRHGLPPAPVRKRTTTWPAFIRTHLALLAGTDFFTAEVLTLRGLVTYYVLFFIHHHYVLLLPCV